MTNSWNLKTNFRTRAFPCVFWTPKSETTDQCLAKGVSCFVHICNNILDDKSSTPNCSWSDTLQSLINDLNCTQHCILLILWLQRRNKSAATLFTFAHPLYQLPPLLVPVSHCAVMIKALCKLIVDESFFTIEGQAPSSVALLLCLWWCDCCFLSLGLFWCRLQLCSGFCALLVFLNLFVFPVQNDWACVKWFCWCNCCVDFRLKSKLTSLLFFLCCACGGNGGTSNSSAEAVASEGSSSTSCSRAALSLSWKQMQVRHFVKA